MAGLLTSATALVLVAAPHKAPSDFGPVPAEHRQRGEDLSARGSEQPGVPVRLTLPAQGVRADVVPVGVTPAGDLAVPADADDAGWFRSGVRPGSASGSAVLVGHVDSRSGELGALAALASVRPGDGVLVRQADGTEVSYRITTRRTVSKNDFPDRVFRTTGPPVLTLITCTGPFQPEHGGYRQLLLVTATPGGRDESGEHAPVHRTVWDGGRAWAARPVAPGTRTPVTTGTLTRWVRQQPAPGR